ncbi:MAG: oligosaccharide flippase family protein [Acidobacteria bacterium]|nr:oligosaccharide flippase family protein [Acidobacteriota bacterium]
MPTSGFTSGITSRWRDITRNIGVLTMGQGVVWAAKFAVQLLLARLIAPAHFAECAIFASTSMVLGNILDLGLNVTCLNFSAGAPEAGRKGIWGRILKLRLILAALLAATALPFGDVLARAIFNNASYATALRLAAVSAILGSMTNFLQVLLQTESRFGRIARLNWGAAALYILPLLVAVPLRSLGLTAFFAGDFLSRLFPLVANSRWLRAAVQGWGDCSPKPGYRSIVAFSNWITLSTAIGAFTNYIPMILLTRLSGATEVAAFSLGLTFAGPFALLLNGSMTVMMTEAAKTRTVEERRAYIAGYLPVATGGVMTLLLLVFLGVPVVESFVGPRLAAAASVFRSLSLAQVALILANPVQFLLYSWKRPDVCTASDLVIAVLYVASAMIVAPRYGAAGVAAALLVSQTLVKAAIVAGITAALWKRTPSYVAG